MFVLTGTTITICALGAICAYFVAQKLFTLDKEVEQRRLMAGKVAGKLQGYGLKHLPALLTAYSVGNYTGLLHEIGDLLRLFADGEDAIVKELDGTFER